MRVAVLAVAAAVVVVLSAASSSFAQTQTRQGVREAFNRCVELAMQRGYSTSDLDGNRAAARNFVIRCMQGKQR